MLLISHRGNIDGKNSELENNPEYVLKAIQAGYDVEIDIWVEGTELFLGHDKPQFNISLDWLLRFKDRLWLHCKNLKALSYFNSHTDCSELNYFWHEDDKLALTSQNYIWANIGQQPLQGSIAVMPEILNDDLSECIGVCSDVVIKYKVKNEN